MTRRPRNKFSLILVVFMTAASWVPICLARTQAEFYETLQNTTNLATLKAYLDTPDPQRARLVVLRIGDLLRKDATPYFLRLWTGNVANERFENEKVLSNPMVKLMLASFLARYDPEERYLNYILGHIDDGNWMIEAAAIRALEGINTPDVVPVARRKAYAKNFFVARSATDLLLRIAQTGPFADNALEAMKMIVADGTYPYPELQHDISVRNGEFERREKRKESQEFTADAVYESKEVERLDSYLRNGQFEKAIRILLPEARSGNLKAANLVGELYLAAKPPEYDAAVEWFQHGVDRGDPAAMVSLANMYLVGRGVEESRERAVELLRSAHGMGYAPATNLLKVLRVEK